MKNKRVFFKKIFKLLLIISFFATITIYLLFISIYYSAELDDDALVTIKTSVEVLDDNNNYIDNKTLNRYTKYSDISPNIINAFIALEDKRFFEHNGLDYHRILGAIWKDIKTLSFKEGASTITQQLAKNTLLSNKKTLKRKIMEMRLARLIEKKYTKEQILEMYLNAIYYGNGIYGIDAACKIYFDKSPLDLTISDSAILAGIVKNPSAYSPKSNINNALSRKKTVLDLMLAQNLITSQEYDNALNAVYFLPKNIFANQYYIPYYNNVLTEASKLLRKSQKEIITNKFRIYTFYNANLQANIAKTINSEEFISVNSFNNAASSSALVANNETGGINAFYSTKTLDLFSFRRQPASTIKPILVYGSAIECGTISPETFVLDSPVNINGYSPKNYNNSYLGWITAEQALSKSINTVAVNLLNETGIKCSQDFAKKTGLTFDKTDGLASALGGLKYGSTQLELAESYMTLSSYGIHKPVVFIKKITDEQDNTIYKYIPRINKAMSSDTAYLITSMLKQAVENGTSSKLNGLNFEIAAKTGTTQNPNYNGNIDAWNISYSTENTVLVWYGDLERNELTTMNITGSGLPTLLSKKIYTFLPTPNNISFSIPDSVVTLEIDKYAQTKDHKLYLSNIFTPDKYRKTTFFSLKNCPLAVSPYFDLKKIYFGIQNNNGHKKVTIKSDEPYYSYILEEKNLLTNNIVSYNINTSEGEFSLQNNVILGIYVYRLKVFWDGKEIGQIFNNPINTSYL